MSDIRILLHKKVGGAWVPVTSEDFSVADFSSITGKPTTLSGYGITDGAAIGSTNTFTAHQNFTSLSASGDISGLNVYSKNQFSIGSHSGTASPYDGVVLFFNANNTNIISLTAPTATSNRSQTLPDKDGEIVVGLIESSNIADALDYPYEEKVVRWGASLIISGLTGAVASFNGEYPLSIGSLINGRESWTHATEDASVFWNVNEWSLIASGFGEIANSTYEDTPSPEYTSVWTISNITYGAVDVRKRSLAGNSIPDVINKYFTLTDSKVGEPDTLVAAKRLDANNSTVFSYTKTAKANHLAALGGHADGIRIFNTDGGVESVLVDNIGRFRRFIPSNSDVASASGGAASVNAEVTVSTGTLAASYGRAVIGRNLTAFSSLSGAFIDCSKNIEMSCIFSCALTGSTGCVRILLGANSAGVPQTSAQDAFTGKGWGIECKENGGIHQMRLVGYNTGVLTPSAWINFTAGAQYPLKIIKTAVGVIYLFLGSSANAVLPNASGSADLTLSGAPTSGNTLFSTVCLITTNNGSTNTAIGSAKLWPEVLYRIY